MLLCTSTMEMTLLIPPVLFLYFPFAFPPSCTQSLSSFYSYIQLLDFIPIPLCLLPFPASSPPYFLLSLFLSMFRPRQSISHSSGPGPHLPIHDLKVHHKP
ncbi:hypothetical protein GE21DRAFT_1055717 [Neurospora crassa]|nr:hypothetical protein B13N20.200 [imported] - Neurospora crassa [Neurospora crassa]KHE87156.1 hypothetical protein GE21DRAFT_1055717 [Neurospora crassa]